jgi:hypothetical protein
MTQPFGRAGIYQVLYEKKNGHFLASNCIHKIMTSLFHSRLLLLIFFTLNSAAVCAQQSLFNVPSVETTEKDKLFFQEQVNFFSKGIANTTLDYGLGNGWEMGLSFFDLDFYSLEHTWNNSMLLLNVQQGFHVTEQWKVGIGTQSGSTLPFYENPAQFASFNYWNNALDLQEWGKYYLGVYYANRAFVGSGTNVNLMAGLELPVTKEVHIMADFINGNNDISGAVIGFVWYATQHWQFSLGSQISTPTKSANRVEGAVLEFTFVQ